MTTNLALGVAFFTGMLGNDAHSESAIFVAIAAFAQACVVPRAAWRSAVLMVAGWAAGGGVAFLIGFVDPANAVDTPTSASAALVAVLAYVSAFAGGSLSWLASRLERHG